MANFEFPNLFLQKEGTALVHLLRERIPGIEIVKCDYQPAHLIWKIKISLPEVDQVHKELMVSPPLITDFEKAESILTVEGDDLRVFVGAWLKKNFKKAGTVKEVRGETQFCLHARMQVPEPLQPYVSEDNILHIDRQKAPQIIEEVVLNYKYIANKISFPFGIVDPPTPETSIGKVLREGRASKQEYFGRWALVVPFAQSADAIPEKGGLVFSAMEEAYRNLKDAEAVKEVIIDPLRGQLVVYPTEQELADLSEIQQILAQANSSARNRTNSRAAMR